MLLSHQHFILHYSVSIHKFVSHFPFRLHSRKSNENAQPFNNASLITRCGFPHGTRCMLTAHMGHTSRMSCVCLPLHTTIYDVRYVSHIELMMQNAAALSKRTSLPVILHFHWYLHTFYMIWHRPPFMGLF